MPVNITVTPVPPATVTPTGDVSLVANASTGQGVDFFNLVNGTVNAGSNSTIFLPGGSYQVKAHYAGDGTYLGSDSAPVSVTVSVEGSQTSLGIVVNTPCTTATSVAYGSPYILSVAVADLHSAATPCIPKEVGAPPTGGVLLTDTVNGVTSNLDGGNFILNSGGYFEDQFIQLPVGTHAIKSTYAGDDSFTTSNSTTIITITKASTTTSVTASPMTASAGQTVTLTATVGTQSNAIANSSQEPRGNVQFLLGGVAFGAPVAVIGNASSSGFAQAVASLPTTTLPNGSNLITAQYSGDSNYTASSSLTSVTVTVGGTGINLSSGCTETITITAPGQSGSCLITVMGANGFSGAVILRCGVSGSPAGAVDLPSCSFGTPGQNFTAPNTITLSAGSETGNATLTVNTTAASGLFKPLNRPHGPNLLLIAEFGTTLACMLLLTVTSRKRRGMVTLAALLFVVAAVVTGCGNYGGAGTGGNPGTTRGTYTYTVTATPAGGAAQTSAITVNVN